MSRTHSERNKARQREFVNDPVAAIGFEAWLSCFDMLRTNWPEASPRSIAEATGVSTPIVRRLLNEGYLVNWCPGPLLALMDACSPAELDDLREQLVTGTLHGEYADIPRYRLTSKNKGERIGVGSWVDLGFVSSGKSEKSRKVNSSKACSSGRSSAFSSGMGPVNSRSPSGVVSSEMPESSAEIVSPGIQSPPAAPVVQLVGPQPYTEADADRLRQAAAKNGIDLSQFADALRKAMLQEMELIAVLRGETLSSIKSFRPVAEAMRRRMAAFARKMREEELQDYPSMKVGNPEAELRVILQFMEIQKRMGQVTGDLIESEQKRLGDAEAWRRRTDTLLFGGGEGSSSKTPAEVGADKMDNDAQNEIAEWLKMPELAASPGAVVLPLPASSKATPTQTSPVLTGTSAPVPSTEPAPNTQRGQSSGPKAPLPTVQIV